MSYFSEQLKELREKAGLYQKDLADEFKVSQNTIHKWENGKTEPDTETIYIIATYFNVSADNLFGITAPQTKIIKKENYLTLINNSLTKISKAKLESYAEGLLASENIEKLIKIQTLKNKE